MLDSTVEMVENYLRTDRTVSPSDRERLMRRLCGQPESDSSLSGAGDRLLRRSQAAQMLGRSVKSIDRLASAGVLRRIRFPSHTKSAGFRLSEIADLIAGRTQSPTY